MTLPPRAPPPLRPLPRTRDRHLLRLRWALLLAALIEFSPVLWSVLSHWHLSTRPPERPPMMVVLAPPPAVQASPPMTAPPQPAVEPPPPEPPPPQPHVEPLPVAEPPPLPKARRAAPQPTPRPTVRPTEPPESPVATAPPVPQPSAAAPIPPAPATAPAAEPQEGTPDGKPSLQPSPIYPREALHDGIEGHVLVRFFVTETGTVADVKVIESTPADVFDRSVLRAASRYKFEPTGKAFQVERDFVFRLKANKTE